MTSQNESKDKPEHDWNMADVKQFGDTRCSNCGMKYTYYNDAIRVLRSWTQKEKRKEPKEIYIKEIKRARANPKVTILA